MLPGTAQAWHEAVVTGRCWEQTRDVDRIREAFVTLSRIRTSWPAPAHFLEALPRVEIAALTRDKRPTSPEEARAALARIKRMLDEPVPEFKPEPKPEREFPLTAVEDELRGHYADRKTAAAGGEA